MPKYAVLFGLKDEALARFIENPEDRRGPVSKLAEAAGGRLESYLRKAQAVGVTAQRRRDS
jgi:hypothetical protein